MIETPKQLINENERLSKTIEQSAKQFSILTSKQMDLELNLERSIEVVNKVNTICVHLSETDKMKSQEKYHTQMKEIIARQVDDLSNMISEKAKYLN